MKTININYDCYGASLSMKKYKHPMVVMKELEITYEEAIPQSMGDMWQFINCKNIPEKLPSFIRKKIVKD